MQLNEAAYYRRVSIKIYAGCLFEPHIRVLENCLVNTVVEFNCTIELDFPAIKFDDTTVSQIS